MATSNSRSNISLFSKENTISFRIFYSVLITALFIFLYNKGAIIQPDSSGYINNATIRSPLYPFLLKLYSYFFANFQFLLFLQLFFGFFAAHFTVSKLNKYFNFSKSIFLLIFLILLSPYYGPGLFGNAILTESICYPLFLLMFCYFMQGLIEKRTGPIIISMILTGLLVLTRGQFLFLYPAFAIIFLYLLLFERKIFKTGLLIVSLIFVICSANLLERSYQYCYHGKFALVPFTGMQLVVAPLYFANESDVSLFKTEDQRNLFKEAYNTLLQKKLNYNSLNSDSYLHMAMYHHYYDSYNPICWGTISGLLAKHHFDTPYKVDANLTEMAVTLILNHLDGFFILYLMNVVFNLGGLYYALLIFVCTIIALFNFVKTRNDLSLVYLLVTLLTTGNYLLIALVEPVLRRYSAYTDVLLTSVFLIIVATAFSKTNNLKINNLSDAT